MATRYWIRLPGGAEDAAFPKPFDDEAAALAALGVAGSLRTRRYSLGPLCSAVTIYPSEKERDADGNGLGGHVLVEEQDGSDAEIHEDTFAFIASATVIDVPRDVATVEAEQAEAAALRVVAEVKDAPIEVAKQRLADFFADHPAALDVVRAAASEVSGFAVEAEPVEAVALRG